MPHSTTTNIMVPMRDGLRLATDIWTPDGSPAPVLLVRLPYGKDAFPDAPLIPSREALVEHGYAVVWQDVRGRYRSEGQGFEPFVGEADDGVDTVKWIMAQPWCDGHVGSYGASYLGVVQWQTASNSPHGLAAIAPHFASTDVYNAPWFSEGGAMSWHLVHTWSTLNSIAPTLSSIEEYMAVVTEGEALVDVLPMAARQRLRDETAWWSKWMKHTGRDDYWKALAVSDEPAAITVPALSVGGWFDVYVNDTANSYRLMRESAGSTEAREGQRLLIGPWDHLSQTGTYPDRDFGESASGTASGVEQLHMRFFDTHLRGNSAALDGDAPVRIFVMGADEWRDERSWPLHDTVYTDYYLSGGGNASSSAGDGELTPSAPASDARDQFLYDPADPVPSVGGRMLRAGEAGGCGPVDQSTVEQRPDVLCYTTPVLDKPIEVTGHVALILHVSSSALDTDFTAKLVDVYPDGRALYLTDGILRMRYRTALDAPELLTPGEVYEVRLDLSVTSNVFLEGHRIRLEVSSSNYPRFDRNTNTGGHISGEAAFVVARNTVLHGPATPSRLVLPLINRPLSD
ncbi:CocE/NonD family hydrolase [Arthrobacter sp. efr-133-TYG-118]|uniref:CocE/NonD family hydrolase n=1 Tax=Arthrobacter sp. efr-133-TYG-118 TaxID=3040279 RepID=UPI00255163AC|nr:CocE/NonD family hydrolase [Arthrobacter sp. efr-133-TYG-118]